LATVRLDQPNSSRVADGIPKATVAREFGISRETLYTYLRTNPGPEPGAVSGAASDVELDVRSAAEPAG
jgi:DNA-binding phage protein